MSIIDAMNLTEGPLKEKLLEDLEAVKKELVKRSKPKYQEIKWIIDDVTSASGKMLRPLMMILAAQFGDYDAKKIRQLAVSVEMLHMATLIHDDVIDDAELRRGKPTVSSKYGKDLAVYAGDFLLAKALKSLDPKAHQSEHLEQLASGIEKICESELLQYHSRFKVMSIKNYLRVIAGKTAALFAISMYVGASESGCDRKQAKQLGRIGYELGMAFQIIDDTLDFSNDQETVGKSVFNDLKKGYFTLPVIYALQGASHIETWTSEALHLAIEKNSGVARSRALAKKYTNKAFKHIEGLKEGPEKDAIQSLASALLDRAY